MFVELEWKKLGKGKMMVIVVLFRGFTGVCIGIYFFFGLVLLLFIGEIVREIIEFKELECRDRR